MEFPGGSARERQPLADGLSGLSLAALFWALNSGESVHWGASAIYKIPW